MQNEAGATRFAPGTGSVECGASSFHTDRCLNQAKTIQFRTAYGITDGITDGQGFRRPSVVPLGSRSGSLNGEPSALPKPSPLLCIYSVPIRGQGFEYLRLSRRRPPAAATNGILGWILTGGCVSVCSASRSLLSIGMDTDLKGGINRSSEFPTTLWGLISKIGHTNVDEAAPALERLCQIYWYPLYVYIRRSGRDAHESEDLAQSFFVHLFENNALQQVDKERGKFRAFLMAALKNFLANDWDRRNAKKRGNPRQIISWEEAQIEERYRLEPVDSFSSERIFERRWALTLVERVFERLQQEYAEAGKQALYDLLQGQLTAQVEPGFYKEAAGTLGMSEGAVKTALHRMRRRFGELLRSEVAYTVSSPEEVEEEIRHLLAVISM